jgi:gamma-glutamyltranspeptidase/glutathione hydrolase
MTPSVVLRGSKPFMVVGTPGGTTIPTSVYQTIINVIDFGMNASAAKNKPKFHHQWLPDEIQVEKDFPQDVRKQLEDLGYKITERPSIGRMEVIKITNGKMETAADKRGDDSVAGF